MSDWRAIPSPTQPPPIPSHASGGGLGWGPGPLSPALRESVPTPGSQSGGRRVRVFSGLVLCALVLSLALAGCGKRNAPEPPPDAPGTFPRPYPSE